MEELAKMDDHAASGKIIIAHPLGSGASITAVSDGSSVDTSMGFTPTVAMTHERPYRRPRPGRRHGI